MAPPFAYDRNVPPRLLSGPANLPISFSGVVTERTSTKVNFILDVGVIASDAERLVDDIHVLGGYDIALHYHTKRVGGNSDTEAIHIVGGFRPFLQELKDNWQNTNKTRLAIRAAIQLAIEDAVKQSPTA
jgi:hypothetical protein